MIVMHAIKNCDTVKKARKWLDENGVEYDFRDFKKRPATSEEILAWADELSFEVVLNKRGTTWRKLSELEKSSAVGAASAASLMAKNNSMIKRPILDLGSKKLVGFDATIYAAEIK